MRYFSVLALWLVAVPAQAAILVNTLSGIPYRRAVIYTENGITTGGSSIDPAGGSIHLDGWEGIDNFSDSLSITTAGLFSPISIDVFPSQVWYTPGCSGYAPQRDWPCVAGPSELVPIGYIGVSGFRDGSLVEDLLVYLPPGPVQTISLEEFPVVDRLRISAVTFDDLGLPGRCQQPWCAHFSLDSVTVRVPEPAGHFVFAFGLAIVAWWSVKRSARLEPAHSLCDIGR